MSHTVDHGLGLSDSSWPSSAPHSISHIQPRSHHPWTGDFESTLPIASDSHSSQIPDIFSPAYDPFASVHSSLRNGPTYNDSPYLPGVPDVRVSPVPSSCYYSQGSSYSSPCPPSEVYSRDGSEQGYTPEVKIEDSTDWDSSPDTSSQPRTTFSRQELLLVSQGPSHSLLGSGVCPRDTSPEDAYQSYDSEYKPDPPGSGSLITNAARIRKRRQLTSPNEANHECPVCGKLFGRSYNFKAHMETHDPSRAYPHVCDYKDCEKKFVRKTDLTRHQQSVHIKQRNYQCGLCGNLFARKDTLRRHTEDGCAKRFDITSKVLKGVNNNRDRRDIPAAQPVMTSAGIVPMRTRNPNAGMSYEPPTLFSRQNSPLEPNSYSIAPRGITW